MTGPRRALADAVSGTRQVLIDFDGPFCSVFAGLPAAKVSELMLARLAELGHAVAEEWQAEADPLALLRLIGDASPRLVPEADTILTELEAEAAHLARPNPEVDDVLVACADTGRSVVIVSNNAAPAIGRYVAEHGLTARVARVVGRVPGEPESMKPSPRLLLEAVGSHGAAAAVFIGDAVRDVAAGHAAGIPTIGYANKPRKERSLADAGAVAVVTSLLPIARALSQPDG